MRKAFLILIIISLALFGCVTSGKMAKASSASPEGMFVVKLPSASGMGRLTIIQLFENGNAIRTSVYIGEPEGDYIEEGTWTIEHGEVKIILKNTAVPPKDVELSFRVDSEGLTSIKYDETPFNKTDIRFTRVPEGF